MNRDIIKKVEQDLRNYPLWLLNVELPGLGRTTDWSKVYVRVINKSSLVENIAIDNDEIERKVNIITGVLAYLDPIKKKVIEEFYFRNKSWDEILEELSISKSTLYAAKRYALSSFATALAY